MDKVELFNRGKSRGFYDLKNRVNDLTGKEWVFSTKTVIPRTYYPSFHHDLRNKHGGQKPPELCAELISTFTKYNDIVLDPFAGVGGTLLGCSIVDRLGIGIEINKEWIDIYMQICHLDNIKQQIMIEGDSRYVISSLRMPVDCIITDIPYWNMDSVQKSRGKFKRANEDSKEIYSEKSHLSKFNDESSSLSKESWLSMLETVFQGCFSILKNKGYAVLFVGNMYNNGEFHYLSADVANLLKQIGFVMKGEIIWYDVAKKLHLYGINYDWIPSMVHQTILVFRKA